MPAPFLDDSAVDAGKPFMPAELTPLFHTPSYRQLSAEQCLRYNQLQALYFNEQIMFFETVLGRRLLEALLRRPWPERLAGSLVQFLDQERQHTEMFRRLNRHCAPRLYADCDFFFVRVPGPGRALLEGMAGRPLFFSLFLWIMLIQEERSLFYSRTYLSHRGSLEPQFVQAHRRHLADEVWHVEWDEELIDVLAERSHPFLRRMNAKIFAWMLDEFFGTPKRAQLRVIGELARQVPELAPHYAEMRRQLLALAEDSEYRRSLYSPAIVPRFFARFEGAPELRGLEVWG
jgi:P-aminobenzoate N-oxygenase AurF